MTNKTLFFWVMFFLLTIQDSIAQTCNRYIDPSTPISEFIDHKNGTITHIRTGLMWKKCFEGEYGVYCNEGEAVLMHWKQALEYAESHSFGGYSDWRLPNIKELASISEVSCTKPAVNAFVFSDSGRLAWSSTPDVRYWDKSFAFDYGLGNEVRGNKLDGYAVILVR